MRATCVLAGIVLLAGSDSLALPTAEERRPPVESAWGYLKSGDADVFPKSSAGKRIVLRLRRGSLIPILELKVKGATRWARVRAVDLAALSHVSGWIDVGQIESLPVEQFPQDAELLRLLGGPYLDDYTAGNIVIARFLIGRGTQEPALACLLGSRFLSHTRLQVFPSLAGNFVLGPYLEFPASEIRSGVAAAEVRDLVGDGNECLVTEEQFSFGPENHGVKMVIRRVEGNTLRTLWEAPLELRNLASYPARPQLVHPLENNIGNPGTVTCGKVEFRRRGNLREPVWRGSIELYALGREEPLETVAVEKVCPWQGTQFAPLQ